MRGSSVSRSLREGSGARVLGLLAAAALVACGVKAPPRPPEKSGVAGSTHPPPPRDGGTAGEAGPADGGGGRP